MYDNEMKGQLGPFVLSFSFFFFQMKSGLCLFENSQYRNNGKGGLENASKKGDSA